MAKDDVSPRFGPGQWVTVRATGTHVKVEAWSRIAAAYRLLSGKGTLQFASEAELEEVCAHPDVDLGKYWPRCQAAKCGAPLTPGLAICARCHAPICSCGRCRCGRTAAKVTPAKAPRKKVAARAR